MLTATLVFANLSMAALNIIVGNRIIAGISIGTALFIVALELAK